MEKYELNNLKKLLLKAHLMTTAIEKRIKGFTKAHYGDNLNRYLSDWMTPSLSISKGMWKACWFLFVLLLCVRLWYFRQFGVLLPLVSMPRNLKYTDDEAEIKRCPNHICWRTPKFWIYSAGSGYGALFEKSHFTGMRTKAICDGLIAIFKAWP